MNWFETTQPDGDASAALSGGVHGLRGTPGEHFVQFYESDHALMANLFGFVGVGLMEEGSAIIIATSVHRRTLEQRLTRAGVCCRRAPDRGPIHRA